MSKYENLIGKRIELVKTNDPYTKLTKGSKGIIQSIDKVNFDGGFHQVWVKWDSGSSLALIPEKGDRFLTI
jgi:hypothetical protein